MDHGFATLEEAFASGPSLFSSSLDYVSSRISHTGAEAIPTYAALVEEATASKPLDVSDIVLPDVSELKQQIAAIKARLSVIRPLIKEMASTIERLTTVETEMSKKLTEYITVVMEVGRLPISEGEALFREVRDVVDKCDAITHRVRAEKLAQLEAYQAEMAELLSSLATMRTLLAEVVAAAGSGSDDSCGGEATVPNACPVCMERPVNRVLDVCGHTVCDGCLKSLQGSKCFLCRKLYARALPFFLN